MSGEIRGYMTPAALREQAAVTANGITALEFRVRALELENAARAAVPVPVKAKAKKKARAKARK